MCKKGLIRKMRLLSKFMSSQTGNQTIVIQKFPNLWRSKGNITMKFGQLIEYNTRNIVLEKSYIKCGGETIPRRFSEKSKLSISLDHLSKILCLWFYCMWSWGLYIEGKLQISCFYLIKNFFETQKWVWN